MSELRRFNWHIILLTMLIVVGCTSRENEFKSGLGRISFSVTVNEIGRKADDKVSLTLSSADGQYSRTWADINDFPSYENFHVGRYIAKAYIGDEYAEGVDCAAYVGVTEFEVVDGATADVSITCNLSQAMFQVSTESTSPSYRLDGVIMHTSDYGYVNVDNDGDIYILPGSTYCYARLSDINDREIIIQPDITIPTKSGEIYSLNVALDKSDILSVRCGEQSVAMPINPELFDSEPPTVQAVGFDMNSVLTLTEGFPTNVPIVMDVTAKAGIKALQLTVVNTDSSLDYIPAESDLFDQKAAIFNYGLKVDNLSSTEVKVDFTSFFENLKVNDNTTFSIILQATDYLGRISAPVPLKVMLNSVAISVESIEEAVIGVDEASVTLGINVPEVQPSDFELFINNDGIIIPVEVTEATFDEAKHTVTLHFLVTEGIKPVNLNIKYLGEDKLSCIVGRKVPEYTLNVDAFATYARIKVVAPTAKATAMITKYASINVANTDIAVLSRDIDEGLIICSGFTPDSQYTLSTVVIDGQYQPTVDFTTEEAQQLPDADFEDSARTIKYDHLASGGIYSSTSFPIFNKQNFVDINMPWPKKYWASINAKTFCRQPNNRNTWFMQLAAYIDYSTMASGMKSICINSVGWSFTGSEIEPYVQSGDNYQPYSGNAPKLDHVSAGYLFLGSYSIDPKTNTEVYTQGYGFRSRPSSLNGYYKYTPDINNINDRGWATVELVNRKPDGTETVIATGKIEFSNASYFRSFNIPLVYSVYNLNATEVRVQFCSSVYSEGMSFDDPLVPVSADLPDACYKGSSLWLDNLSFSY